MGLVAARMVVARSDALVPVVVPRRASIGSQKGVPNIEVLRGVMGARASASQRCSVIARHIRPRPNFAMKLMASGVTFSAAIVRSPSFSRSSSSTRTIMLPGAYIFQRFFHAGEWCFSFGHIATSAIPQIYHRGAQEE